MNRELRANLREVVAEMRADAGCFDQWGPTHWSELSTPAEGHSR